MRSCISAALVALGLMFTSFAQAVTICVPSAAIDPGCGPSALSINGAVALANPAGGDTVLVGAGVYGELVLVDRPLMLQGQAGASLLAPTGMANEAVVRVEADNVTVDGFTITVNQPFAAVGVYMPHTNADPYTGLTVSNNVIETSGVGADAQAGGFIPFPTRVMAISVQRVPGSSSQPDATISGNTIGSALNPFHRAVYTRQMTGFFGGPAPADGNTVYGEDHDFLSQFLSNGNLTIQNNQFMGWGDDGGKGAQLDITEMQVGAPTVQILDNTFSPQSGASPNGSMHVRSAMIKNQIVGSVAITGNTFTTRGVGLLTGNARDVLISDNQFTADPAVMDFTHIEISNKVPTGGDNMFLDPRQNDVVITGNDFVGAPAGPTDGIAIEFLNHNATPDNGAPVPPANFTVMLGGNAGNENTFSQAYAHFLRLDEEDNPDSQTSLRPFYGAFGSTTMLPFDIDFAGGMNLFDVDGNGAILPVGMNGAQIAALESLIFHQPDDATLGLIDFTPVPTSAVADDDAGPATCPVDRGFGYDCFVTIQEAIDAIAPGGMVEVLAGNYDELVTIDKTVTLFSDEFAALTSTIGSTPNDNRLITVSSAIDVTIRGLTLNVDRSFTSSAVHTIGDCQGLTVLDNIITLDRSNPGQDASFGRRNAIIVNAPYEPGRVGGGFGNVTVSGNTITGTPDNGGDPIFFRAGIQLETVSGTVGANSLRGGNDLTGNDIQAASHDAILRFSVLGELRVEGNTFRGGGLQITEPNASTTAVNILGNQFLTDNATQPFAGFPFGFGEFFYGQLRLHGNPNDLPYLIDGNTFVDHFVGLHSQNMTSLTVSNNNFTPTTSINLAPPGEPLRDVIVSNRVVATNNPPISPLTIETDLTGNSFLGGASNARSIEFQNHNDAGGSAAYGAQSVLNNSFDGSYDAYIHLDERNCGDSMVCGNPDEGPGVGIPSADVQPFAGDVDASSNTWDGVDTTNLTAAQAAAVENRVFHQPDNPALGLVNLGFNMPDPVYVDDDFAGCMIGAPAGPGFCGIDAFATIQEGVDNVATGGTVNIFDGTYDEQVVVTRDMTLDGESAAGTRLAPTAPVANSTSLSTGASYAVILLIDGGAMVDISDLGVDGAPGAFNSCSPGYIGVYFRNSSGSFGDGEIVNVFHPGASGCQAVIAALVQADAIGGVANANFSGNVVGNYGKGGIVVDRLGATSMVSGNTVTGRGPTLLGDAAQNGVQFSRSATGSITGNSISNHSYVPETFVATGILLFDADADTDGNNLDENHVGMFQIDGGGTHQNNTVTATGAGTQVAAFWGLIADDPPEGRRAQLFEGEIAGAGTTNRGSTADVVLMRNNTLISDGMSPGSIGIETDSGFGASDIDFTATGNEIRGWGTGVVMFDCDSGCTGTTFTNLELTCNVIAGNDTGLQYQSAVNVNAENNWWGCNDGPNDAGGLCDTIDDAMGMGTVDSDPWLVLGPIAANPTTILPGGTSTITVDARFNSDAVDVSGFCDVFDTQTISYTAPTGTMTPPSANVVAGESMSDFSSTNPGLNDITATLDSQDLTVQVFVEAADLVITKTDTPDPVIAGEPLIYTITVVNNGPADAANVQVTDTLPVEVTLVSTLGCAEDPAGVPVCSLGTISNGGMAQYTINVDVNSDAMGMLTNTASVSSDTALFNTGDDMVTEDTVIETLSDLTVSVTDNPDPVPAGGVLTYTVTAFNSGPSDAQDVMVTAALPPAFTPSSTSGCAEDPAGTPVCSLGVVGPGGMQVYTITGTVDAGAGGSVLTINVNGATTTPESNTGNNSAFESTQVGVQADLSIVKDDGATFVRDGQVLTYFITVSNAGPNAVVGADVEDILPAELNPGTATWVCTPSVGATCTANGNGDIIDTINLAAGAFVTYELTVTVSAPMDTIITNTAEVIPPVTPPDPNPGNNMDSDVNSTGIFADGLEDPPDTTRDAVKLIWWR